MPHVDATAWEDELETPTIVLPRGRISGAVFSLLDRLPGVDVAVEGKTHRGRLLSLQEWYAWQARWQQFFEDVMRHGVQGSPIPEELEDRWDELLREYLLDLGFGVRVVTYVESLPGGPQLEILQEFNAVQARAATPQEE